MLLSLNMLGRQDLVSGVHRFAAKCLLGACAALSVLTLFSLMMMALPWRGGVHMYIGLAVVAVVVLTAAAVHCYFRYCRSSGGDHAAESNEDDDDKHKEELEAAWKITSSVTNSAFGGLIGVLSSVSKITGAAADSVVSTAAYASIFFMFATAIVGVFVATVSKKMPEITRPQLRRLLVTAITLANAFLLCTLACAAFAAAFVVLRYRVFAAFAPLVITAVLCLLLRYCVARRGRAGEANDHQERIKAIEDLASKVTMATFAGIMTVLGASVGEKESRTRGAVMLVLTSAFLCGLGFMLIAAAPASARALLAPAAEVLEWSSLSLFAATAVAVYAVVVGTL